MFTLFVLDNVLGVTTHDKKIKKLTLGESMSYFHGFIHREKNIK